MALFRRSRPPADTTSRVTVRNGTDRPLLFIFEPWCWTAELAAGGELICEATSPRPGWLEVEYTPDAVTVTAWDASVARVLSPEGELLVSLDLRVPDFIALDERAARRIAIRLSDVCCR